MVKHTFCSKCASEIVIEVSDGCYCDEDQGAGYTYSDEHGDCDECEGEVFYCPKCREEL